MPDMATIEVAPANPKSARRSMGLRLVVAAIVGGAIAAGVAWTLSSDYSNGWLMVPVLVICPLMGGLWVRETSGRSGFVVATITVLVVSIAAGWWAWTPEPALFGALRSREHTATTAADESMAALSPGACVDAGTVKVVGLDDFRPWGQLCRYGTSDGSVSGILISHPNGSSAPGLVYQATGGSPGRSGLGCIRHVVANWWATTAPSSDLGHPCARQYTHTPPG
jgi:hypothetical protein